MRPRPGASEGGERLGVERGAQAARLRRGDVADAASVASLNRRVRREALGYLPELHDAAEDLAFFQRVARESALWLAERDGVLLGFGAARPGWLDHLYVDAGARGRGIGRSLVERLRRGESEMRLWVFQRNRPAIAFYESLGFRLERETDGQGNEEREPDALFVWRRPAAGDGAGDAPISRRRPEGRGAGRPSRAP